MTTPSPNELSQPTPSAQCEALFKLFEGPTGWLRLGRLLKGHEAGRLVLLRDASTAHDEVALSQAVDSARCIAHPNISKLLGIVWLDGSAQLASEYVDGVSLLELTRAFAGQPTPIDPRVAARIICDALSAVASAKDLLRGAGAASAGRCLFSDTLWIAEFGETLLMEAGVATLLNPESAPFSGGPAVEQLGSSALAMNDVRAAGLELFTLLTNRVFDANGQELLAKAPPALAAIVRRALSDDPALRYADPATMSRALAGLPAELIASEREVGVAIQESMRSTLKGRRQKLSLLERLSAVVSDADESTQFFGATGVTEASQKGTLPPPKDAGDSSEIITARPPSPDAPVPRIGPVDDSEDETRVFRAKEVAAETGKTVEVRDPDAEQAGKEPEERTERALRAGSRRPSADAKVPRSRSTGLIAVMSIVAVLSGISAAEYFGWLHIPGVKPASAAESSKLPWPLRLLDR
jgi:hypothetical protein